ncbi:Abi family protein [Niallia sp. MER 6]|uniref:Abi family protein n=1 Tax=Niallia TaxID=2837506 RepID=UPI0037C96324
MEHHFRKYDDNLPIWVALEMTSFGFLSKFYRNLNEDLINHLAKIYFNVPYLYLDSWLQTLSNVRIVCAFYGQLYNKKLPFNPLLFREDIKTIDNLFIFAAIYITQRLLTETDLLQI